MTERSKETGWLAFCNVSSHDYFFSLYFCCVPTSKEILHLSRTKLDSQSSFFLMLHSQMVSQRAFSKVLLRATLCCFSPVSLLHLPTCLLSLSVTFSVFVSAEEITHMEKGTCQLTCSSFITVSLCSLYAVGESAVATCVYLSVRLHHDSEDG